jgi:hypothetical protein
MSRTRLKLIKDAWGKIDANGDGVLTTDDLVGWVRF